MGILRILLVLGLLAGCAFLVFRAPWIARLDPTAIEKQMGNAPLWAPPATPALETFPGFVKGAKLSEELGARIVVEVARMAFFARACTTIVGLFLLFGIAGTIIQRRPATSDVAFSLWLSLGLVAGIVVSATIGRMGHGGTAVFPFLSECLLAGFVAGLMACIKSQTRLPFERRMGRGRRALPDTGKSAGSGENPS